MPTVIHRCPACGAPVEALPSRCTYCGAMVVDGTPAVAPTRSRTETWGVVVMGPVGPSNRARVAETLRRFGVSIDGATRFVEATRTEIVMGTQIQQAKEFAMALREAGASAVVEEREIQIPLEPDRAVVLDAVGASAARVVVALRAHVEIDLATARRLVGAAPCTLTAPLPAPRAPRHILCSVSLMRRASAQRHTITSGRAIASSTDWKPGLQQAPVSDTELCLLDVAEGTKAGCKPNQTTGYYERTCPWRHKQRRDHRNTTLKN